MSDVARDSILKMTFLPKLRQAELSFPCLTSRASSLWRLKKSCVHPVVSQRKFLKKLRTGQRTHIHAKSSVPKCGALDRKAKSEQIFTCATSPTAVSTVTSTEATTSAAVPWPRLRSQPPLTPSSPCGLIRKQHPQAKQPRVSTESDVLCGLSIGLVCSGGTAHPPPHSLVRSKHPLKPSRRSNIHNSILAAFLCGHIHRAK